MSARAKLVRPKDYAIRFLVQKHGMFGMLTINNCHQTYGDILAKAWRILLRLI